MKTRTLVSVSAKGAAPQLHICDMGRGIGNACHPPAGRHSPGCLYRRLLTKASSRPLQRSCSDTGKACRSIAMKRGAMVRTRFGLTTPNKLWLNDLSVSVRTPSVRPRGECGRVFRPYQLNINNISPLVPSFSFFSSFK